MLISTPAKRNQVINMMNKLDRTAAKAIRAIKDTNNEDEANTIQNKFFDMCETVKTNLAKNGFHNHAKLVSNTKESFKNAISERMAA